MIKTKLQQLMKMKKKVQKTYVTYYNLLLTQDLWQVHDLVNNFSEGIHRIKCRFRHDHRKCEACAIKCNYCDCFLEYINFKNNLIEYKCLCCNKNYLHKLDEKLKERFFYTYKFSNQDNNKFILL